MRLEQRFVAMAHRAPGAVAVVTGTERWSYGQLLDRSLRIAAAIELVADDRPERIGIAVERGGDGYAAVLGALSTGAAYVPINPHHPAERIARTVALADLDAIVVDEAGRAALGHAETGDRPGPPTVALDHPDLASTPPRSDDPTADGRDDDVAYLLFTSGTTGEPKGVPITHRNVGSFLDDAGRHHGLGPGDRCSQTFDLTFDLSVFDLFMAWQAGASLHTLGVRELLSPVDAVRHHELTTWFSVPSVAALALRRGALAAGAMPSLRRSLFCGEALPADVAEAWAGAAPGSDLENLYGPTELTIACTRHRWQPGDGEHGPHRVVPIGRPFDTMVAAVVDSDGREVPSGYVGELCLDGPQRFRGYWRRGDLTRDRLVAVGGRTYYRTGDRVVERGGVLHFCGRADDQVQVLGHRVELGEVEAALRAIDGVVDAVAFGLPVGEAAVTSLGAAVTLRRGSTHDRRSLRRAAAARLPDSARPRLVEVFDELPTNDNGKLDRSAVASLATSAERARAG